jgi:hypothetical protein
MVLFAPDSLMTLAIAANPGWYTAPDSSTIFPWGTQHPFLFVTRQDLIDYTNKRLVLMRGTADTIRDSNLNTDPLSDVQGRNRYERAAYFYQKGFEVNSALRWLLLDVVASGHEYQKMAAAAATYLDEGANDVQRDAELLPRSTLFQNYPNPFNPKTVIRYQLSVVSSIDLRVFDMLGREVAVLASGVQGAGSYTVNFDASNLASGMYFYHIRAIAGDRQFFEATKILLLVK